MSTTPDFCGLDTSLPSAVAVSHWNVTIKAFLAHGAATPVHLEKTLELAPEFAQGFAAKGLFCLLLGRKELIVTAQELLAKARGAKVAPLPREALYIEALSDWLLGRPSDSAARLELLLVDHPGDALAMKLAQAIRFVLGQPQKMLSSLEQIMPAYTDHQALGFVKGCYAFALEETGNYDAAERAGREGLLLAPNDAWGLHAVAHVYDMTARAEDGLYWMAGQTAAWEHCNNFRFHVWWHIALMHLDLGQYDEALALYDKEVRFEKTDDYRDISNGASMLSRLEIEGVDIGDRWEELAELSEKRTDDACVVFADLHYMLSLIGGGRKEAMRQLMARMARDGARAKTEMECLTRHPGLSAASGLEAFGEGRYDIAFANLQSSRAELQSIGGSHAQRDVFERLTVEAALRSGYFDAANRLLDERQALRAGHEDGYTARHRALISQAEADARLTAAPNI